MTRIQLPEHQNPSQDRAAHAPYNFVPLPDVVVKAVERPEDLPEHDTYNHDAYSHTGCFQVTLKTLSPLYIRGGLSTQKTHPNTPSEFEQSEKEKLGDMPRDFRQAVKNKPNFFTTTDPSHPVIPGSSLRGMLRSLIEIITYSKVQWVTDKRLFFRTVGDSAIGKYYNSRMVEPLGETQVGAHPKAMAYRSYVRGGFLRTRRNGTYYIEECDIGRIEVDDVVNIFSLSEESDLYELRGRDLRPDQRRNPNQTPKWKYQHRDIEVDIDQSEQVYFFPRKFRNGRLIHPDLYLRFRRATGPGTTNPQRKRVKNAKLVLTGRMENKHMAFVFIPRGQKPTPIDIPNDPDEEDQDKKLIDRFHDDDQLTRWQKDAFSTRNPPGTNRPRDGYLADGDPVFFLIENGQLTFFGRAQMFRLPYLDRPLDLIPPELRDPGVIDFAEAMFGFVRTQRDLQQMKDKPKQGKKGRAYASRIFVTDAKYDQGQGDPWLPVDSQDGVLEPAILASPKPTSFQHYLTQEFPNDPNALYHYDSNEDNSERRTTIRGLKLYWPQGKKTAGQLREMNSFWLDRNTGLVRANSTQHTRMKPVNTGKTFSFRVHFENLSDVELGALQWTLTVPGCYRLGMGKPFGMGVIDFQKVELHLTKRPTRYKKLFFVNDSAEVRWNTGEDAGQKPEDHVGTFEEYMLEQLFGSQTEFRQIPRIQMLLKMLEWQDPDLHMSQKQYMTDIKIFAKKLVLPDPLNLNGVGQNVAYNRPNKRPPAHQLQRSSQDREQGRRETINQEPPSPPHPAQQSTSGTTPAQFTLAEGVVIRGKVFSMKEGNVAFDPDEIYLIGVPKDKGVDAYVPQDRVGDKQYRVDFRITAVIEAIEESKHDLTIKCRPATKEESKKGRV